MKAVQIDAYGGPENMVLRDIATPEPGAGEALVRLEYAGVNYTDVYNRNGMYAKSHTYANSPPFTWGAKAAAWWRASDPTCTRWRRAIGLPGAYRSEATPRPRWCPRGGW